MPTFEVDVQGKTYEVDAPDPNTAWQWANQAHNASKTGEQADVRPPVNEKDEGFIAGISEAITGRKRSTKETETLPEWTTMPELNQLSWESFKTGVGTMFAGPDEIVKVIKANAPNVQTRKDAKGNWILRSAADGKEYAIPPGFSMGDLPRAAGAVAAFLNPFVRGATTIPGAAVAGAGTQAVIEGSQAATGGEVNPEDIAISGVAGAGGEVLARGIRAAAPAAGAVLRTARQAVTGRGRQQLAAQVAADPAEAAAREAEAAGIPVLTTDVVPPTTPGGQIMQRATETLPVIGTGGMRRAQQAARQRVVEQTAREMGADATIQNLPGQIAADFLRKRGSRIGLLKKAKDTVINKLSETGLKVPMQKSLEAIDVEIKRLQGLGEIAPVDAIKLLQTFRNELQKGKTLDQVELARKLLGEQLSAQNLANIKSVKEAVVNKIYPAVVQDMGEFISSNGAKNDFVRWQVANKNLRQMVEELDASAIKNALNNVDATPEKIMSLIGSKNQSDLLKLYKNLSQEGRSKVKVSVLNEAMRRARDADGNINPQRFVKVIGELDPQVKTFFTPADMQTLDGLKRVMDITKRAQQATFVPRTGEQLLPFTFGGMLGSWLGLGGTVAAAGGIGAAARAYESKAMRTLLVALSKSKPNSVQEKAILQKIKNITTAAQQSRQNIERPEE